MGCLRFFAKRFREKTLGKSEDQRRRWEAPRKKAVKNFVAVVGDKEIANITRNDKLDFRQHWLDRIVAGEVTANSANKDLIHLGDVLKTANTMKRLGLTLPLGELSFKEGEKLMGTGFCQTMMASAKPVAIFGMQEETGFSQRDLFRLALPLAPVKVALLSSFALWVWPAQIAKLAPEAAAPVSVRYQPLAPEIRTAIAAMPPSVLAVETSLRPVPRPERAVASRTTAPAPSAPKQTQVVRSQPRTLADQVSRDLRRAGQDLRATGRQLERDLSRLFR